jgi:hypothetical protein
MRMNITMISVIVRFNEKVNVSVGATIVVSFSGEVGNITLYAAAQTNVQDVVFNKQNDNTTNKTVPLSVYATVVLNPVNHLVGSNPACIILPLNKIPLFGSGNMLTLSHLSIITVCPPHFKFQYSFI